jgi:Acyl-CoA synthetase (NDP forming)
MSKEDAIKIIDKIKGDGRVTLTEYESKNILAAYDFPVTKEKLARDEEEAVNFAEEIGYPVVLKIVSPDITHKTDVGGVKVNVKSPDEVKTAYNELMGIKDEIKDADIHGVLIQEMAPKGNEVILGMTQDPQFGPVLMFGLGGVFVEVLKDVSFRIPPLTRFDAEDMIKEIKAYPILEGVRGGGFIGFGRVGRLYTKTFGSQHGSIRLHKRDGYKPPLCNRKRRGGSGFFGYIEVI